MKDHYVDSARERALRDEMVATGRMLHEKGLIVGSVGNVSCRQSEELVLVTPSGLCKGMLRADQLLVVDMAGERVGAQPASGCALEPTSELPMHLEVYRQRSDAQAVIHAHPPTAVALSIAGIPLTEPILPEVVMVLGAIPTTSYATLSSEEDALAIRDLIVGYDAIVLQRHGALTAGDSLRDAFLKMELIEHYSRVRLMLLTLGRGAPLPPDQVEKLLEQRRLRGWNRPAEEELRRLWCV
jgi:L-fuculose-phosphate aldolase